MIIVITFFFFEHLPLVKHFAHTLCTQFTFIALKKNRSPEAFYVTFPFFIEFNF